MDSILLFPPGASGVTGVGSAIQLGSWLNAQAGGDLYGAQGLIESVQAQNALRDGGVFAFRHAPVRKMAIPLLVNTPSPVMWEGMLARYSTPGAYIAVQPEGVPSAQAVYFDVIDGRWEPAYDTYYNRARVRQGVLHLDTQPWGYWPTEILLASAASVGFMGQLAVNGASVIGDVPPLVRLQIAPTTASGLTGISSGSWYADMVAMSLSGRPSFAPFLAPAAWVAATLIDGLVATLTGDKYAPASQALAWVGTTGQTTFRMVAQSGNAISSGLDPAYRGRFRAFGFFKGSPSAVTPFTVLLDADRPLGNLYPAMASANQVATVSAWLGATLSGFSASPAYSILDMGELTLPPSASGAQQGVRLRLWFSPPGPPGTAVPSSVVSFGGVYLLPVDGAAGIQARGLYVPSQIANLGPGLGGTQGGVEWNTNFVEGAVNLTVGGVAGVGSTPLIAVDGRANYRGLPPRIGASTNQLLYLLGDRITNFSAVAATSAVAQGTVEYAAVQVSYRPQFQFLYGI